MVMMVAMLGLLLLAACGIEILTIQNLVKKMEQSEMIMVREFL
jgi:hypothetical protein